MNKPSLGKILIRVLVVHLIVLVWLGITRSEMQLPLKREKLLVQTVTLSSKKPEPAPKKAPVSPKSAQTAPKSVAKKAPPKKVEKSRAPVDKDLFKKAQENIAKIHKTGDKRSLKSDAFTAPKKIESLSVEEPEPKESFVGQESNYYEELTSRLKLLLKLPEFGPVKVKLTVTRSGKVEKLEILSGESAVNCGYVEKTLPTLKFPGFGQSFGLAANHTFTITLENEF